jgi:hypothetical protein
MASNLWKQAGMLFADKSADYNPIGADKILLSMPLAVWNDRFGCAP